MRSCLVALVSPTLILTASHCVPWENATMDGEMLGGCWVRWPTRAGHKEEVVDCARIRFANRLSGSQEKEVQKDFAYIELKSKVERPVFSVRSRPMPQSAFIRLYGVEIKNERRVLHERLCQHQPDLELQEKTVERGMAVLMPECPVRSGDSGSPLLDENREIVGVLSFLDRSGGQKSWQQTAVGSLVGDLPIK